MMDIFESHEFQQLEKLCHAKKISFILGLTKFSSCIKPKKGASYVMSDFFVDIVPETWERVAIRPTPPQVWLNPRPPPALSMPLSRLLNNTLQIKTDFMEVWNHIHGVMTESYHCPKLYLTQVPRKEVAIFMDIDKLPQKEFLSCVDIVYFPVFASWIKSFAGDDDSPEMLQTRVKFVGLLLHIAFKLYNLDPELHIKSLVCPHQYGTGTNTPDQTIDLDSEDLLSGDVQNNPEMEKASKKDENESSEVKISDGLCEAFNNVIAVVEDTETVPKKISHDNSASSVVTIEDELDNSIVNLISDDEGKENKLFSDSSSDDIVTSNIKSEASASGPTRKDNPGTTVDSDRRIIVSDSLGKLIQICVKLLSQDEYRVLTRKISKYINYLPEPATKSEKLASFIDVKCSRVKEDSGNVFVYLKEIFDEMKRFRSGDNPEREDSEPGPVENGNCDQEKDKTSDSSPMEKKQEETESGELELEVDYDTDKKTLKKVLQSFLENCRGKFSTAKLFQPHFKSILKLMENLDPSHVNSSTLKMFVHEQSNKEITNENVLRHIEIVSKEIEKYSKTKKRPTESSLVEDEPVKKKVCLTTLSSTLPSTITSESKEGMLTDKIDHDHAEGEDQENVTSLRVDQTKENRVGQSTSRDLIPERAEKTKKKKPPSEKHIRKLERALESCVKEIQRLEEAEVDWDDEAEQESNYVLCAKYKRRYMQLFKKIAEAKKMSSTLSRKSDKKFICDESRYPEINSKVSKFINKTREFPDFHDIKNLVVEANGDLHLSQAMVQEEAEKVFRMVCRLLKSRRQADDTGVMLSYLKEGQHEDPAEEDPQLDRILVEQVREGRKKMNDFLDDFHQRQSNAASEEYDEEENREENVEN